MTNGFHMPRLGLQMAERYDIPVRDAPKVRAVLLGSDPLMLNIARRLEECGVGAALLAPGAAALAEQDDMFTVLLRDEASTTERVVQSLRLVFDPAEDADALGECAAEDVDFIIVHDDASGAELMLLRALLDALSVSPIIYAASDLPDPELIEAIKATLPGREARALMVDGLCGAFEPKELELQQRRMNYRDDFLIWAQPACELRSDGGALPGVDCDDYAAAFVNEARILGALEFLCVGAGFLSGKDGFHEVLSDEKLRAFVGRAFAEEILPDLPLSREDAAPQVIAAFGKLEDSANALPLTDIGHRLLSRLKYSVRDAFLRRCARDLEAPPLLTLALAATVMLYAGAREEGGAYTVRRGEDAFALDDDSEHLESFARLAHDMPAESLAYAVLADRALWGCDMREADGLEQRLAGDLSSIQRNGFADTLRRRMEAAT